MRSIILLALFLSTALGFSQSSGKLLIISDVPGEVLVDGRSLGDILANTPLTHHVAAGDHLVQLNWSNNGRPMVSNEMATVEPGRQKAVEFKVGGGAAPTSGTVARMDTLPVANLEWIIPGTRAISDWRRGNPGKEYEHPEHYYAFEKGDVVVLDAPMYSAYTRNAIEVSTYPEGFMRYQNRAFVQLNKQTFTVNERCILRFKVYTDQNEDRAGSLRIRRIPAGKAGIAFKTEVKWRTTTEKVEVTKEETYTVQNDTSMVELMNRVLQVPSGNIYEPTSNRSQLNFDLPTGTIAWAYYIGVGAEGRAEVDKARDAYRATGHYSLKYSTTQDPLTTVALGTGVHFARLDGMETVRFSFMKDAEQLRLFSQGQAFDAFQEGQGVNDVAQMRYPLNGKIHLGLLNENMLNTINVVVRVSALVVREKQATRTVRVPETVTRKVPYTVSQ